MARIVLSVLLASLVLAGCGSSRESAGSSRHASNTIQGDEFEGRTVVRVEEMLRGRVAGVEVYPSADGLIVRVRSAGTSGVGLSGDQPLFVIDGLPIELGARGALVGLNPKDIESITVLKSASETAMYGARGANGVVLITTIRPPPPPDATDH